MSTTLSYGYVVPTSGEKGSVWYPILENNITRLNSHSHNGSDSPLLTSTSVTAVVQTVTSAGWAAVSGQPGTYKQNVLMSPGTAFDTHAIEIRNNSTKEILMLSVVKTGAAAFDVYINDNTVALQVIYTS
jgi:hypothetical protein